MKKFGLIFLIILFVNYINIYSQTNFFEDNSNYIDSNIKKDIEQKSNELFETSKSSIKVKILDNINNQNIDDYAKNMFNELKLDEKASLIIIAIKDKKYGIYFGKDLIDKFDKQRQDIILQNMKEYLKKEDYNSAITNAYNDIYNTIILKNTNINKEVEKVVSNKIELNSKEDIPVTIPFIALISFIIIMFLIYKIFFKTRNKVMNTNTNTRNYKIKDKKTYSKSTFVAYDTNVDLFSVQNDIDYNSSSFYSSNSDDNSSSYYSSNSDDNSSSSYSSNNDYSSSSSYSSSSDYSSSSSDSYGGGSSDSW